MFRSLSQVARGAAFRAYETVKDLPSQNPQMTKTLSKVGNFFKNAGQVLAISAACGAGMGAVAGTAGAALGGAIGSPAGPAGAGVGAAAGAIILGGGAFAFFFALTAVNETGAKLGFWDSRALSTEIDRTFTPRT